MPVALDIWYAQRREDAAGDYYRGVVLQREGVSLERTTQGFYLFEPGGTLLRGWNNRDTAKLRRNLAEVLEEYEPVEGPEQEPEGEVDTNLVRRPPEAGLVLDVFARILAAEWPAAEDRWDPLFRASIGRDHLWVRADEVAALAEGRVPDSLVQRLVRFHLIDNTRGEPPMWRREEVLEATLALEDGVLRGSAHLATADGALGYEAKLLGRLEVRDGVVTGLDLVALGDFHGEGRWTHGAPPGEFTLGVAFRLAGGDAASRAAGAVPPQGSRDLADYLGE